MPNVMSTFSLDIDTIQRLDRIADALQAGKSETIRKLVEEKFEQLQTAGVFEPALAANKPLTEPEE